MRESIFYLEHSHQYVNLLYTRFFGFGRISFRVVFSLALVGFLLPFLWCFLCSMYANVYHRVPFEKRNCLASSLWGIVTALMGVCWVFPRRLKRAFFS